MAVKGSKQKNVQPIKMVLNGGLNYAQTPANLEDNELRRAHNFIYDPSTDFLITRPGTTCVTTLAAKFPDPILAVYYYEKSGTAKWLVCASGGNLYYLNVNVWVFIGALHDSTTVPSFLTFNTSLLIADGGTNIKKWTGSVYSSIATSPNASVLTTIGNRVVANHVGEPDSVYLSKTKDETDWNTSGSAVGVKAGYGDNMTVNAFGVFKDDLLVFKKGDSEKAIYRLNVADATTTNWYVAMVSFNNCAQNSQAATSAWNNVFFVDTNGFKSIKGVDTYGDLEIDSIGRKINTVFTSGTNCDFMTYIPLYNTIWFGMGDRMFCYTERGTTNSSGDATTVPAFTDILFQQGRIRGVCQAGDSVYLAGHNGYLYLIDETYATDETVIGTKENYVSVIRTKTFVFGGDGVLKKLQLYLRPKVAGTANLYVYKDEQTNVNMQTIALPGIGEVLYDATGYLYSATEELYGAGAAAWVQNSRSRVRNPQMAFELYCLSGRVGVEWMRAEVAMLEGGE